MRPLCDAAYGGDAAPLLLRVYVVHRKALAKAGAKTEGETMKSKHECCPHCFHDEGRKLHIGDMKFDERAESVFQWPETKALRTPELVKSIKAELEQACWDLYEDWGPSDDQDRWKHLENVKPDWVSRSEYD
jgi:hypothetical protein